MNKRQRKKFEKKRQREIYENIMNGVVYFPEAHNAIKRALERSKKIDDLIRKYLFKDKGIRPMN